MEGNLLTHEEHAARAMLLGLYYDWRDGIYGEMNIGGLFPSTNGALDCLTLEFIETKLHSSRLQLGFVERYKWDKPMEDTPWGRMP